MEQHVAKTFEQYAQQYGAVIFNKLEDTSKVWSWGTPYDKNEESINGFYKVQTDGGTYEHCTMFNPETKEEFRVLCWDYDDVRIDDNPYRYLPINKEYEKEWLKNKSRLSVAREHYEIEQEGKVVLPKLGDFCEVIKGRKLPIGTKGEIVKIDDFRSAYGRVLNTSVVIKNDNGECMKTNLMNVKKIFI